MSPAAWNQYGLRVPAFVISPFAKRNYVSHVVHDHTSVLRFIETKFNLGALTRRDANADNLLDCLDFRDPPAFLEPPTLAAPGLPATGSLCDPSTPPPPTEAPAAGSTTAAAALRGLGHAASVTLHARRRRAAADRVPGRTGADARPPDALERAGLTIRPPNTRPTARGSRRPVTQVRAGSRS